MIDLIIGYRENIVSLSANPSRVCGQNTGHNWVIPVLGGMKERTRAPEECRLDGIGPPAAANKSGLFPVPVGIGVSAAASYRVAEARRSVPDRSRWKGGCRRLQPPHYRRCSIACRRAVDMISRGAGAKIGLHFTCA